MKSFTWNKKNFLLIKTTIDLLML